MTILILNQSFWNRKIDKLLALIFASLLVVIGTIRWKTGFDWGSYYGFYVYVSEYVSSWRELEVFFEPIFTSFYFIAKYSGFGFVFVQFLQIFLIMTIKYQVLKRYTPYLLLGLFLNFCFFPDIVTVRNYLAGTVVLLSLKFIEEKRILPFLFTILVATNIHVSSAFALLMYPLYHKNYALTLKISAILLSVVIGLSGILDKVLGPIVGLFGGYVGDKLSFYVEGEGASKGTLGVILGLSRRLIILPIILYFEYKHFKDDKLFRGLSNLFIFGNIIYFIVGNGALSIFQRFSIPFYLIEVILLIKIYSKLKIKSFFFIFLMLYGFSKFYFIYNSAATVQPYINIFDYKDKTSTYWEHLKDPLPF